MSNTANQNKQNKHRQAKMRLWMLLVILIGCNILASQFHIGIDLTADKKFTLSNASVRLLKNLKDVVVVDVYLKGEFPSGFKKLSEATKEKLNAFQDVAGTKVVYRFINPFEGKAESEKEAIFKQLADKGINGVNLQVNGKGAEGYSEKIIFPYALVSYNGKSFPVKLLESHLGMSPLEVLNYSESQLEYKFVKAIHTLELPDVPSVAYIVGHEESLGLQTLDLLRSLDANYNLDTIDITSTYFIPNTYDAIVINKPKTAFEDKDKFKIDQYVMHGGHVLWMVDMLQTPMDSLQKTQQFVTLDYPLNLDDLFFKFGFRINTNLIEDMQCNQIPVTVGMNGDQPQIELRNWIYFPVMIPESKHPIVNNMDAIMGMFVNSIDTVENTAIEKTVLLSSSKYSRVAASPMRVSLTMLKYPQRTTLFNQPNQPIAVLLEGNFNSLFANRLAASFLHIYQDSLHRTFKGATDKATSMIVIADGDIAENDFSKARGPMEMGYWRYSDTRYANKTFVLNCLEYLVDQSKLMEARTKESRLRLLDAGRVTDEKLQWQIVNIILPIVLILIFASAYTFIRKRKFEVKSK